MVRVRPRRDRVSAVVRGRLRHRPGHRVPGRQSAGVHQLAGETGQAERGRRYRDHREKALGRGCGARRRPDQVAAATVVAGAAAAQQTPADQHVAGPGHRRVLRHAHAEDIVAVDTGRGHRSGTGPTR